MFQLAFEEWFDFGDENTVKILADMIKRANENDHFEFHRLKYLTEIEIAEHLIGSRFTLEDVEEMREQYEKFEEKINQIEDDRKYRDQALNWLSIKKDSVAFLNELTLDLMRAWILSVTIYSKEDYIVHWIDGSETEIGDISACEDKVRKLREKHNAESHIINNIQTEEDILTDKVTKHSDFVPSDRYILENPIKGVLIALESEEPTKEVSLIKERICEPAKDITQYSRKEESVVALPQVTKIDHKQHMKMMSRIYKDIRESNVPKIEKEKLKVAAYVRVSTDKIEQETSLKTQIAFYTYTILKNPEYEFAGIYVDEGITGTSTKHREGFNRMIADSKAGKINLILTKSISRFSRNTIDAIKFVRMLRELETPTYVFFEKENISSKDENSELLVSLMGALAQQESRNIGSSISWGRRALASKGDCKCFKNQLWL
jgi:hypothetical protein